MVYTDGKYFDKIFYVLTKEDFIEVEKKKSINIKFKLSDKK